jgi:hypothetical protein
MVQTMLGRERSNLLGRARIHGLSARESASSSKQCHNQSNSGKVRYARFLTHLHQSTFGVQAHVRSSSSLEVVHIAVLGGVLYLRTVLR